MRLLYISEIVGKAGIWCVKTMMPLLKREFTPDCVIMNVNSATGGGGIGKQHAGYLKKLGGDVLTAGSSVFLKKDLCEDIEKIPHVLRPANLAEPSPGRGFAIHRPQNRRGAEIAVISLVGTFSPSRVHGDNPFVCFSKTVEKIKKRTPCVIVDFHAPMTAEKQAFFYHAEGVASAVIGSGGKVQTTDAAILAGGTAAITDAGRTGSLVSVGGHAPEPKIFEYLTGVPDWTRDCWLDPAVQGAFIKVGPDGKAEEIRAFTRRPPQHGMQDTEGRFPRGGSP